MRERRRLRREGEEIGKMAVTRYKREVERRGEVGGD